MKKHLCRALLALTLALAVTGTTLPTAWAAESEENAPLDCASALLMEAESGRVLFDTMPMTAMPRPPSPRS